MSSGFELIFGSTRGKIAAPAYDTAALYNTLVCNFVWHTSKGPQQRSDEARTIATIVLFQTSPSSPFGRQSSTGAAPPGARIPLRNTFDDDIY
jgi:hypothetical protein